MNSLLKSIDFTKNDGLVPAIIQDERTKQVVMLGYMDKESFEKTLQSKNVWFYSRSRQQLWMKGETSGNVLEYRDAKLDCDNDALLISVILKGPTCHTGCTSCFGDEEDSLAFLDYLFEVIQERKQEMPKNSYTDSLFQAGLDRIIQKVGEETTEVVIAAKNESRQRLIEETADLFFHLLVLLSEKEVSVSEIVRELRKRHQ